MIKEINKDCWRVDVSIRDSKKRQFRITRVLNGTFAEAQDLERELNKEIYQLAQLAATKKPKPITVKQVAEKYLKIHEERGGNLHGVERNINYVVKFFGSNTYLQDITPLQADEYRDWHRKRNPKLSNTTINRATAFLRAMLRFAMKRNMIEKMPINYFEMLPEHREPKGFLRPEEVETLIDNADPKMQDIIYCLIYTGCRKGEILSLRWEQVDFDKRLITLTTKDSKRRGRTIYKPISDPLMKLLHQRQERNQFIKSPFVFPSRINPFEPVKDIRSGWSSACKKSGLINVTPHLLRHTFASWLTMETNGDLQSVSRLVGHSSINITNEFYAHLSSEYLLDKANIIGNILPLRKKA